MKDVNMLVWLTQLGLSFAVPLAGFLFLAVWLNKSCGWGSWVIWVGLMLGLYSAVASFRSSLVAMKFMAKDRKDTEPPPVSFNDHI